MSLPTAELVWYIGIGLGVACLVWVILRVTKRKPKPPVETPETYLDQTCELNYNPDDS